MDEIEKFFKELQQILDTVPTPKIEPLEYRIHYDDIGNITMCTMQQHPNNQQYLVVDKATYDNYFHYCVNVKRKRLEKVAQTMGNSVKLKKSDHGYAVVKNHAGLIIENNEEYPNIEYYDTTD